MMPDSNQLATCNSAEGSNQEPSKLPSTSQDEVLVKVEGVSKKFCRSLKKSLWYGVCDIASELNPFGRDALQVDCSKLQVPNKYNLQHATPAQLDLNSGSADPTCNPQLSTSPRASDEDLRPDEFYAVRDVSFELRRGECLGLIGRNGAGKTTLLKMLNGLIKPDSGTITMRGRIGALIALGAGFNPILTGRENVYINGSVLGLRKPEIDAKLDEIIDFADIREFIDSPVRNYSSGMTVRLGFAVATAMNPDVLIIDEVLAVGDAAFRARCANRIDKIRSGCAVIFVSHNMEQVRRICSSIFLMQHGKGAAFLEPTKGILAYNQLNVEEGGESQIEIFHPLTAAAIEVVNSELLWGENLVLRLKISADSTMSAHWRLIFRDNSEAPIAEADSRNEGVAMSISQGQISIELVCSSIRLRSGEYDISLVLLTEVGGTILSAHRFGRFRIASQHLGVAPYQVATSCKEIAGVH